MKELLKINMILDCTKWSNTRNCFKKKIAGWMGLDALGCFSYELDGEEVTLGEPRSWDRMLPSG